MLDPSLFQVPPPTGPAAAAQMFCGGPPATATFFKFPRVKYAIHLPSGDQNINASLGACPSIVVRFCGVTDPIGRINSEGPVGADRSNPHTETHRPSGDTAKGPIIGELTTARDSWKRISSGSGGPCK